MEVRDTGPGMASILQEMGVSYNPRRLANALKGRQLEINTRALRITYTLGRFIAGLAKVSCLSTFVLSSQASRYGLHAFSANSCVG